jgi:hypothetical protein
VSLDGRDSSFAAPTLAQARAAHARGVRVWGGYLGSRDGLGLAVRWNEGSFWNVLEAGMTAIGFCSGHDDPGWISSTARAWGILPCADVERGIRDDGPWVRPWVQAARCGLYGLASVHHEAGEPTGRDGLFNVVARYPPAGCSGLTWDPVAGDRPPGVCGWQCQGSHLDAGLEVDRAFYDDGLARLLGGVPVIPVGGNDMSAAHRPDNSGTDLFPVRPDGGVEHWFWGVGTSDPTLFGSLGGMLVPGSVVAWWQDGGKTLVVMAQAADGFYWKNVWFDGSGWSGWIRTAMSGALPVAAAAGAHRHQLAAGFTGVSEPVAAALAPGSGDDSGHLSVRQVEDIMGEPGSG